MLDVPIYLDALGGESAALATAARRDLMAPIPSCPGWTMTTLVVHLAVKPTKPRHTQPFHALRPARRLGWQETGV
jgi:hypothetical protein